MKNIHVISTDKPSRLWMTKLGNLTRCHDIKPVKEALGNNVNIYITNDEEIKEGEYQLYNPLGNFDNSKVSKAERLLQNDGRRKKIILTTDQDLIKDGIQAIDDEFLEWFVQNPSCEEVEVVKTAPIRPFGSLYKTIIPKEESKQETLEEAAKDYIENTMRFSFNSMETKTQANRMLKCVQFGAKWQMNKQDEFTLGFLHWYNTSQECETYLRRNYPKNITMNGEHYKKVLQINKELLEMYKNTLPR